MGRGWGSENAAEEGNRRGQKGGTTNLEKKGGERGGGMEGGVKVGKRAVWEG